MMGRDGEGGKRKEERDILSQDLKNNAIHYTNGESVYSYLGKLGCKRVVSGEMK